MADSQVDDGPGLARAVGENAHDEVDVADHPRRERSVCRSLGQS
jgi:hypothetical protein